MEATCGGSSINNGEEHMSREAMQLALEALESDPISHAGLVNRKQAITALRQALETEQEPFYWSVADGWVYADDTSQKRVDEKAKREHEPVAWISEGGDVSRSKRYMDEMGFKCNPLYTAPPKREWVGLHWSEVPDTYKYDVMFMEGWLWAEAKLKEKNNG